MRSQAAGCSSCRPPNSLLPKPLRVLAHSKILKRACRTDGGPLGRHFSWLAAIGRHEGRNHGIQSAGCLSEAAGQRLGRAGQGGEAIEAAVVTDQDTIVLEPLFTVRQQPDGQPNFLGPYAKGSVTDRFFYLVWATPAADGSLGMFRRVKVPLHHLPWAAVEKAVQTAQPITVELTMTDAKGALRSGSLRVDEMFWLV